MVTKSWLTSLALSASIALAAATITIAPVLAGNPDAPEPTPTARASAPAPDPEKRSDEREPPAQSEVPPISGTDPDCGPAAPELTGAYSRSARAAYCQAREFAEAAEGFARTAAKNEQTVLRAETNDDAVQQAYAALVDVTKQAKESARSAEDQVVAANNAVTRATEQEANDEEQRTTSRYASEANNASIRAQESANAAQVSQDKAEQRISELDRGFDGLIVWAIVIGLLLALGVLGWFYFKRSKGRLHPTSLVSEPMTSQRRPPVPRVGRKPKSSG